MFKIFGKFNKTNGDFLASVVFKKYVKNHGWLAKIIRFLRFLQKFLGKLELKKKIIVQDESLSTELRAILTVLLFLAFWPSY